ncbi:hypothetical protein GCM10009847_25660 [Leucobacter tardus]
MSHPNAPGPEAPQYAAAPIAPVKEKNTIGLIAFIVAVVGFIFACIPGALIIGWILLPIAFILGIVALCLSGKKKGLGLAGLIISVVGTIVAFVVFFTVVATAFDDAFSNGETSVSAPAEDTAETEEIVETEEAPEEGSRSNPYPLGSAISDDEWTITVNSVNLDATDAVAAANEFNEPAPEGEVYVLADVTVSYIGTDAAGDMPTQIIEYVTVDGNTVHSYDAMVLAPEPLDSITTLYEGASTTGNVVLSVPADTAGEGVLAVTPSVFGDKVFVAVR